MFPNLFAYTFGLIAFFTLVFDFLKGSRHYIRYYNLTYLFLVFLVAFRYGTGMDTPRYMLNFSLVSELNEITLYEIAEYRAMPGYILLVSAIKTLFGDFFYLQLLQAGLYFSSFYLLLKRLNLRKFYILLVFYGYNYFAALSGMRECFALSFCFFALVFYMDHKYWLFYLFVLLGFLFHTGVFVFFLLPLLRIFKSLKFSYLLLIVGLFIVLLFSLSYVRAWVAGIDDSSISRYAYKEGSGVSILSLIANCSYLLFFYYFCFKRNKDERYVLFIYMGIVFLFVNILAGFVPILYRYSAHFAIFFYYCINTVITKMRKGNIWRIYLILLFFYSPVVRFIAILDKPNMEYCFVFSPDKSYYDWVIANASTSDMYED